ncbi:Gx transporter family protein [Anaerosalibacter bizertensis]|uniref:Gx transporter family protein n=1 Tax=Anaerosalibacter bizertensis TaxID=932217 RepID=A0A844FI08_9FIRM|nr:Gx transporter family protein [Anaerosalibacter bizertensis]MBV1817675.1 Gx transporter family protein [Bacteroidales bacterium MSK.15.36]MBU5294069.1 Gx transporter family protein [Anaerosalibacter bizertensis]MCB5558657.1 Gx transporter family protein [Anaerosalibacter bizertensis]MCG4565137.1 Gx transporter family protein [Anaerosalibacter bizertensis]MCG4582060.1 Gx transporter family protein [Anaerosalibacter bizertensis]
MEKLKRMIFLSLLVSLGLALSIIESFMPVPFIAPGAKLGLSNMVILVTLVVFGFKEALIVGILKSLLFTLVTGSVSSLFYSLTGTVFSSIAMFIVYLYFSKFFSLIGVSIFGAVAHNTAQVLVASLIMNNFKIFSYLPILLLISLFTGYFTGLASIFISKNLKKNFQPRCEINKI